VLFGWENMDRQLSPLRQWIRQFVFNTTQLILAGNHDGAEVMKQWGFKKPIEVMPQMGVDTTVFAPPHPKPSTAKLTIGFVGRLSYHKGIDLLIEAARILRDLGHDFQITLCGSGSDEPTFKATVNQYNLGDQFVWRGGVRHDEVPQEMAQFDILVLPSRTIETWKEQFGHVLIEAMAMAIPVVGSTCGEIPNVVGHPDLVFPEGDAIALAKVLERLICEPEWRQQAGQHSLDRVHRYYTHECIAQRLIQLWQKILEPKDGQGIYQLKPYSTSEAKGHS
jgi:glycosyltransferase involved in cell wall biosynthesis